MTWTRLTVHWIVSDCDLEKVSVYTPNRGCVGLHVGLVTSQATRAWHGLG